MNKPTKTAKALDLSWSELGRLCHGLSFASRPIAMTTNSVVDEYSLGPRGAWILEVISTGYVTHPLELTKIFRVGRSLITAELARLTEKDLIVYQKSEIDGRRVELSLTPLGEKVAKQVRAKLTSLINERLGHYSVEEIELCSRMLRDFLGPQSDAKS